MHYEKDEWSQISVLAGKFHCKSYIKEVSKSYLLSRDLFCTTVIEQQFELTMTFQTYGGFGQTEVVFNLFTECGRVRRE